MNTWVDTLDLQQLAPEVIEELDAAERPLLIYGAGIRGSFAAAQSLWKLLCVPLVVTWAARDLFPDSPSFGTHGEKAGNLAVQNADYILCIGSRLDTKATGSPLSSFAPKAKLVMVDIDEAEIAKMGKLGRGVYRSIPCDAAEFLRMASVKDWQDALAERQMQRLPWINQIGTWRGENPVVRPEYRTETAINPYVLMLKLSELMEPDDVLVSDTGCGLAWIMQAFQFRGQRFVHAFNQTPMGYGLPAAVGAAFATGRRVVLVTGDGGLAVNITELATIARHKLNVKILLLNNYGHALCRQTQRQWLGGIYPSTSYDGGLATPDYAEVAAAYDFDVLRGMDYASELDAALKFLLSGNGPRFYDCKVPPDADVQPQIKFGEPLA